MQGFCIFLLHSSLLGVFHFYPSIRINQRTVAATDKTDDFCSQMNRNQKDNHYNDRGPFGRLGQQDCHRTEKDADRINRQNGRAVRQAHVEQAVMQVPFVRAGNWLFVHDAAHDCKERVPQRNAQHDDRDDKGNEQRFFKSHDRQCSEVKA